MNFSDLVKDRAVVFCGDSHLLPMKSAHKHGLFYDAQCKFVSVHGATAVGLRHPKSKTMALARFREKIEQEKTNSFIILQLGEVDCGFVIWYRASKYNEPIERQFRESIDAYRAFLKSITDLGYRNIIVTSATLPTIRDGELGGEVALLRSSVTATQRERTDLTLAYNSGLRQLSSELGVGYIDISGALLDPETGLIRDKYRHPNPKDHHLHPIRGGKLWAKVINEKIYCMLLEERISLDAMGAPNHDGLAVSISD